MEKNMIIPMFQVLLYKTKFEQNEILKNEILPLVTKEYLDNPTTFDNPWDSDVFTTFNQENNKLVDWDKILPMYISNLQTFAEDLNISGTIHINNAWVNVYGKNQTHELHDHLPGQFSAIHFLSYDPEVHFPTAFVNPYKKEALSNSPRFISNDAEHIPPTWTGLSKIDVDEGDIIFFPSFLEHKAPRQHSDKLRVIVSFNFNFI